MSDIYYYARMIYREATKKANDVFSSYRLDNIKMSDEHKDDIYDSVLTQSIQSVILDKAIERHELENHVDKLLSTIGMYEDQFKEENLIEELSRMKTVINGGAGSHRRI